MLRRPISMIQARVASRKGGNTPYQAALVFLTGHGSLKQSFKRTRMSSTQMKYATGYVLRRVPLQPTDACHEVYFYVDHWTYEVRRVPIGACGAKGPEAGGTKRERETPGLSKLSPVRIDLLVHDAVGSEPRLESKT